MAISGTGTNISFEGWVLQEQTTQPSGDINFVYKGRADTVEAFLAYIQRAGTDADPNTFTFDDIVVSKDPQSGVATVTINAGAATVADGGRIPDGETRMPTVAIQGTMLSPPLHQCPHFVTETTEGDTTTSTPISITELRSIEWGIVNKGIVTLQDVASFPALVQLYARWRQFGMETYLAASYTMTVTRYLNVSRKPHLNTYIREAGKIWKFATLAADLPSSVRPVDIGVPAWLAQAPSVSYTKDGITLTQAFIGAEKFPAFYPVETGATGLTYDPPALPDGYSVQTQETSGEE